MLSVTTEQQSVLCSDLLKLFYPFCIFFLLTLAALPPKACTSNSPGVDSPQATRVQLPCIIQNFGMRYKPEFSHEISLKLPSLQHHLKSYLYLASSLSLVSFSPSFIISPGSTSLINHLHIHSHLRVCQTYDYCTMIMWHSSFIDSFWIVELRYQSGTKFETCYSMCSLL